MRLMKQSVNVKKEAMDMRFFPRTTGFFEDVFDDFWPSSVFRGFSDSSMKTDIMEQDGRYLLNMELPGCRKEDIRMELSNGYLTIMATRKAQHEEKDRKGDVIRQERISGNFQRSFYVGEGVSEQEIRAAYNNGELRVSIPKKEPLATEKKYIAIE